ncbi:MH2 domain containing protein [Asbolus verrucosus]|uniref:MH2 domain containing protein n=1 Tax=Asbolus verrucosus TaxID=1661398 RepID=A0A482VA25_ASBVE|nr:MH2 domain containing protein [Asbolus verrucosus]
MCNDREVPSFNSARQQPPSNSDDAKTAVEIIKPPWATITYYELTSRVGESFKCHSNTVYVDGHTNPDKNKHLRRFRLGDVTNPGRSFDVINVRKQIGGGVRLNYVGGELFARCESESQIFVQSRYYNCVSGYEPDAICRMSKFRCRIMPLFEDSHFVYHLTEAVKQGCEALHELKKMCTIKMSFGRGWGKSDEEDSLVPCWIIIRMEKQLNIIKEVLREMEALGSI